MKFDQAYNVMKNPKNNIWIKMEKLNKTTMEWVPIKKWLVWSERKYNMTIQSIAIETENGFRIKVHTVHLWKIADIFLKGVKNYEVHHSKSIWWNKHI